MLFCSILIHSCARQTVLLIGRLNFRALFSVSAVVPCGHQNKSFVKMGRKEGHQRTKGNTKVSKNEFMNSKRDFISAFYESLMFWVILAFDVIFSAFKFCQICGTFDKCAEIGAKWSGFNNGNFWFDSFNPTRRRINSGWVKNGVEKNVKKRHHNKTEGKNRLDNQIFEWIKIF